MDGSSLTTTAASADGRRFTWSEIIGCLTLDTQEDVHGAHRWDVLTEQVTNTRSLTA